MRAEVRNAVQQVRGVERHVDARNLDEGPRARGASFCVLGERSEPSLGAGDGVLDASNVVVDDFQEFAGLLRDGGDVREDVLGGDAHLIGAQGRQAIVGDAVLVALDEAVHGETASVDDVNDRLEREDLRVRGERVVLTHGVAREEGGVLEHAGFLHLRDLGAAQGRHSDLRELREIEHAVRVSEGLPCHDD